MDIGEEGGPQGVLGVIVAASVKLGREEMPVPPITAMWTGSRWLDVRELNAVESVGSFDREILTLEL